MCASACHAMPMVDGLWMGCAPTTHVCVSWHTCVHQTAHTAGERCLYLETACVRWRWVLSRHIYLARDMSLTFGRASLSWFTL